MSAGVPGCASDDACECESCCVIVDAASPGLAVEC